MKVDENGWKWMKVDESADADAYADADAMIPSSNPRIYTLRSVPSSPGRSFVQYVRVNLTEP